MNKSSKQIGILAELNACSRDTIVRILTEEGEMGGRVKRQEEPAKIPEGFTPYIPEKKERKKPGPKPKPKTDTEEKPKKAPGRKKKSELPPAVRNAIMKRIEVIDDQLIEIQQRKNEIEKMCKEDGIEYPEGYNIPTPPQVAGNYMAEPEKIREDAKNSLALYEKDENYHFLLKIEPELSEKEKDTTCIKNVIGYVSGLRDYIETDDLLGMRRHRNPEWRMDSFKNCRERVEKLRKPKEKPAQLPTGQLSIFDLYGVG